MRSTFKVLFYLKKSKDCDPQSVPVMGRITVNGGKPCAFSCKISIAESQWDVKGNRAKGRSVESERINSHLNNIRTQIGKHYQSICDRDSYVTAEKVRNSYLGLGKKYQTLIETFTKFNEDYAKRVGVDRTRKTWKTYCLSKVYLQQFMEKYYKVSDKPLVELESSFIEKFHAYLLYDRGMQPGGLVKHLSSLKYVVKLAFLNGWMPRDPFALYRYSVPQGERAHLDEEELGRLLTTKLGHKCQDRTRDMFVFSCFTGICHSDMRSLRWKQIVQDSSGDWWITGNRNKTGTKYTVKLLPIPQAILRKYKGMAGPDKVFIIPEVGVSDRSLKYIAAACGIEKNLTFHMARHTFATTIALQNGVPLPTLKTMLGHKHVTTTEIYARTTEPMIDDAINRIQSNLKERFGV